MYGRGRIRFLGSALRDCSSSSSQVAFRPSRVVLPTAVFNAVYFDPSSTTLSSKTRYCCDIICYTFTATSTRSNKFKEDNTLFVGCVLSILADCLCDVYMHIVDGKELWDALIAKFGATDAGSELYIMESFHNIRMVNNRSIVEQAHEMQCIAKDLELLKCALPDKFVAGCIIAKLPPSWRNFATTLKHKRQEISVENLIASLDVEEKARAKDTTEKGEGQSSANMVQKKPYNKNKGNNKPSFNKHMDTTTFKKKKMTSKADLSCFTYGETGHFSNDCPERADRKKKTRQVNTVIADTSPTKRTPDEAEELLARISRNHDDWNTPEPTPTPIFKKRGLIELNDEDMREAKKSLKEKDKLIPTDISLQMADKSTAIPVGICEDVPVQVTNNCLILTDFVVLEMPEDDNMSIILGRPFLNTAGAVIDCNKGNVTFNVDDKEHTVYFPKRIDKPRFLSEIWHICSPKRKMDNFNFGEVFQRETTSTGRPSRTATRFRRSYNEDVIAPSFAPEEDNGAPNASSFPCYDFLSNAGLLDDFFTLVNRAGLAAYVGDEREQYYMLTKIFVESFKFHNKQYGPTVAFKIYGNPITMELEEFCVALDIAPVGTSRRIEDNPRVLLELYRGIANDDCRTIQRGKIRNIQLPAIKYFAYYIATSILGRENTSNISSYHLAFLIAALRAGLTDPLNHAGLV
ncbi:hypothetical protein QYE76_050686 [Lolium multiflorum]|uniref:Arabidopsis retrotransposon Orf1 C-terminal domain-containing protein n=1 Tax=Lolium multiflorum TaxID=4521 RepID=A0AAD8WH80_LOLMU|nr:hypothetical protein QYE76_050686 [Lolium multiflorum]